MIVRAAVQAHLSDGRNILLPVHRHCDAKTILARLGYSESDWRRDGEGFLTEDGTYLDREEAARYALKCGQISEMPEDELLFSEHLW